MPRPPRRLPSHPSFVQRIRVRAGELCELNCTGVVLVALNRWSTFASQVVSSARLVRAKPSPAPITLRALLLLVLLALQTIVGSGDQSKGAWQTPHP